MKKFIKIILIGLLILIGIGLLLRAPDADKDTLIAKYSNENSQFLTLSDGTNIHYRDEGQADGPALILIHGSNASLHTWEKLVKDLSEDFRLISLDLPGHGLTGPNAAHDYSADTLIRSVTDVLDHLGVKKATFVGNSMGGWLSWRYALASPERTEGVILVNSAGAVTDEPINLYAAAKLSQSKPGQWLTPHIAPRMLVRKSLTQVILDPDQITDELVDRYRDLALFPGNRVAMLDYRKSDREPQRYWDRIDEITAPTLILWGEQDQAIPISHAHAFDTHISNSELRTYPNAAHGPMEEQPAAVAADIRDWHAKTFKLDEANGTDEAISAPQGE